MSMVYDPVTREFRPRETRGEKPPAVELSASPEVPARPPAAEREKHRERRRRSVLNHRRFRELLIWSLFVLVSGALIWGTVWAWSRLRNGSAPTHEQSPLGRDQNAFTL
jgi:hypothetical protein